MFVTWEKKSFHDYDLRGCIGCLSPLKLSNMENYAKQSAFNDPRFDPINESEISKLRCTVSLLHTYEKVNNVYDWEVGKHGITINFGSYYSATFLPEVAEEQNWDQKKTVEALIRKAGYRKQITKYINLNLENF